jgi:hypothetical protein
MVRGIYSLKALTLITPNKRVTGTARVYYLVVVNIRHRNLANLVALNTHTISILQS